MRENYTFITFREVNVIAFKNSKTEKALSGLESGIFLKNSEKKFLLRLESDFRFTFRNLELLSQWLLDCHMWDESAYFQKAMNIADSLAANTNKQTSTQKRDDCFKKLQQLYLAFQIKEKSYPAKKANMTLPQYQIESKTLQGEFFRTCQAFSEQTLCCNLKVLNIIDNCAMDCAYCILHNHYDDAVIKVPTNLKEQLQKLSIPKDQRWRVGTGEHSDSLLLGNKNNVLTDLCDFAKKTPHIILELKTKSSNVEFFLHNNVPPNICCSWTLNSPTIIAHEEHKTAGLKQRLRAARLVANRGVKIGFHLHPMIYYKGWEKDYQNLIGELITLFEPHEVLWLSFGTVTIIKGLEKELRKNFRKSKVLQMAMEVTPDNKTTYPYNIRTSLYQNALEAASPWQGKVFQYLCMEPTSMWEEVMGMAYGDSDKLNDAINKSAFGKIKT
ncbi:MAG: hypothetical protein HQK83_09440 [Fibrobacteria bacterium]|nr:hypothetical protein [Fibrobacteria bacterium]